MTRPVLPTLDQPLERASAGAKATALATLVRAGLPVPAGIVIPVDHPDRDLAAAVTEILTRTAEAAPYGLIARSSAVGEDGTTASFAGLYTSRIAPAEPTALLAAVRAVRASAHGATAAAYSRALATTGEAGMAVLVQPALRPACSGVLAARVSGSRCTRWRIETVHGLAEPLVSGRQTGEIHTGEPDGTIMVHASVQTTLQLPGAPAELALPPGEWVHPDPDSPARAKIQTSSDGVLTLYAPADMAEHAVLADDLREQLLRAAAHAAGALCAEHIDVEWAVTFEGRLHLVQARPLTTPLTPVSTGTALTEPQVLHGIPAAPGIGTGPAVLDTAADTANRVLVCDALGPEAVAALLARPAAVVSTTGGPLSHTAIIARELAIPCVTNVTNALTAITPGTTLEVDGTAGTVRRSPTVPAQRTAQQRLLTGTAVLTHTWPRDEPTDGRAATILLHAPHGPALADLTAVITNSTTPVGMLIPTGTDTLPAPDGYRTISLSDMGVLLWPASAMPPPTAIAVLGPDQQILHQRSVPQPGPGEARFRP
ncbi:PEP/pyruvate-binding domain-containing protein [Kitasatospora sp. NPDC088779]|uniref:PEP/pyruvate-binding domain-containing protein n=1 Tax=Kitasatospora sp. NPDC088779 TaxID=3154964 RepID=UPI00341DC940